MTHRRTAPAVRALRKGRFFRLTGTLACLVALLMTVGGHWLALQSVAWGKMLIGFSRHDSFVVALSKTFDGQHLCSLCLQIQAGQQNEREEQRQRPLLRTEHAPEFLPGDEPVILPEGSSARRLDTPLASTYQTQSTSTPPKPPPRAA